MTQSPLDHLEEQIKQAQGQHTPKAGKEGESVNMGARAGIELVGAIVGSCLIGYLLDRWLETAPIFFFIFFALGIVTGFYNIYKITQNFGTSVGVKGLSEAEKNAKDMPNKDN